ncbi:MAG: hypothetical protein QF546_07905 [Alphaproteobacteria bacterium]|nr:hypothetical protein [Alphaproteobacteria bacterium]HJP23401.1 hypothetical protein [Alphaproteobacteria bacterium]
MTEHRYPPRALVADYLRAGVGLVLTLAPLLFTEPIPVVSMLLGGMAILFAFFALRTALRQITHFELSASGIRAMGPRPRDIAWAQLEDFSLRYYSTRRDGEQGWLQLKLAGAGNSLKIDSALEDFDQITAQALAAAGRRGLACSPATLDNLRRLGLMGPAGGAGESG